MWVHPGAGSAGGSAAGLAELAEALSGDPDAVRELAGRFRRQGLEVAEQADRLRSIGTSGVVGWDGGAASAYRSQAERLHGDLAALAQRCLRVAVALLEYAGALAAAQAQAARALAAVQRHGGWSAVTVAQVTSLTAGSGLVDGDLLHARALLAGAQADRDRAASRCAHALAAAADDRLRDPSGWHRLLGAVSRWAGRASSALGGAAVLLLPVPGLGEVLGGAALALGGVALAADALRWTSHDPSFHWGAFLVDALALLPAGRALRAAAVVSEGGAAARLAGGLRGVPTTAGTLRLGARQLADGVRRGVQARSVLAFVRSPGGLGHELAVAAGTGGHGLNLAAGGLTVETVQTGVGLRGLLPPSDIPRAQPQSRRSDGHVVGRRVDR